MVNASTSFSKRIYAIQTLNLPTHIETDDVALAGRFTETIKSIIGIKKEISEQHKSLKQPYLEGGRAVDGWKSGFEKELDAMRAALEKPLKDHLDRREAEERARLLAEQDRLRKEAEEAAAKAKAEAELLLAEAADSDSSGLIETAQELLATAHHKEQEADIMLNHAVSARPAQLVKARAEHGTSVASQRTEWVGRVENYVTIDVQTLLPYLSREAIDRALNAFVKDGGRSLRGATIQQQTKLNVR